MHGRELEFQLGKINPIMRTFHNMRKRVVDEFSDLCEALCTAQEWLEEGDLVNEVRSGFDTLTGKGERGFEKYEPHAALKR